jgi:hypothetical protein
MATCPPSVSVRSGDSTLFGKHIHASSNRIVGLLLSFEKTLSKVRHTRKEEGCWLYSTDVLYCAHDEMFEMRKCLEELRLRVTVRLMNVVNNPSDLMDFFHHIEINVNLCSSMMEI